MEGSENIKSSKVDWHITILTIVGMLSIVFLSIFTWFRFDSVLQQREDKMQSLTSKCDSLRVINMAMVLKLQEKPMVFIPKYTPTIKIDENYVRDKMGDWIWYNKEPETLCQWVANMINEQQRNAYWEGFKKGYNKGRE